MASKKPMEVAVVGGSLAGLFAGIVLVRLGHNVTILERSTPDTLRDQGAGINVAPHIQPIVTSLKQLGIASPVFQFFEEVDRTGKPWCLASDKVSTKYLNRDGSVKHATLLEGFLMGVTSWEMLHDVLRQNFDGVEKQISDGNAKYLNGSQVILLKNHGSDGVVVEYLDSEQKMTSMTVDLVIAADGASSTVRGQLFPEITREIAGYVVWRGTVEQDQLSPTTRESLGHSVTMFFGQGNHVVHYPIPDTDHNLAEDKLVFNVVWYSNYSSSSELDNILTDTFGIKHRFTLPYGKMRKEIASAQKLHAASTLPPQLAEVFQKVEHPFLQVVTDNLTTQNVFMEGKVLLVGDATAGFRPHVGVGSVQGALHALLLKHVYQDNPTMALEEWEMKTLGWSTAMQKLSVQLGQHAMFGDHPMADKSKTWTL